MSNPFFCSCSCFSSAALYNLLVGEFSPEQNVFIFILMKGNKDFRGRGCQNIVDVEENTIHKIRSHSCGSALSNPQVKNAKKVPPKSKKMLVADAVLKEFDLIYVVPVQIFVIYTKNLSKRKTNR